MSNILISETQYHIKGLKNIISIRNYTEDEMFFTRESLTLNRVREVMVNDSFEFFKSFGQGQTCYLLVRSFTLHSQVTTLSSFL